MSSKPFVVNVFDVAKHQEVIEGSCSLAQLSRLTQLVLPGSSDIKFNYHGYVNKQDNAAGKLSVQAELNLRCDRCGEPLRFQLNHQAQFFFVGTEAELNAIPVEDDEDEPLLGSERFDLQTLLEDEAILALPLSPRHAQRTECQSNTQVGAISDVSSSIDDDSSSPKRQPFAVLANLKTRKH